ncbi:MAG: hypothetical protein DMF89_03480 [Acidobacteria bacterium]|nr:MAG: hypothetical protein DMF89_03480 [Acidobacteriota bacterium]
MVCDRIIQAFQDSATLREYTTAVSLHAHTNRSKEIMADVAPYLARIPIVARLVRREMQAYVRRNGQAVDFTKGWWHPPLGPEAVLHSETAQIVRTLGLMPLVSITDHDTIDAGLALRPVHSGLPISFEWTVPFREGFFHLGVHNLPPATARDVFGELAAYTRAPAAKCLSDLLGGLNRTPETLLILNHPLWDLAGVGSAIHVALLRRFLGDHGPAIHGLEMNGYRSPRENQAVRTLAEACGLPVVSGGDRHGCAPNSLLNLTTATSFGAFVREIREHGRSVILVMPQYRNALVARKLTVAAEAMRLYPANPTGQQRWTDRVAYDCSGVVRSLSDHWPSGGPLWVRSAMRLFQLASRPSLLPLFHALVWLAGATTSDRASPATVVATTRRGFTLEALVSPGSPMMATPADERGPFRDSLLRPAGGRPSQ